MNLTFSNLSYSVRSNIFTQEKKQLLSNIHGDFRSGELTAIMGPSGSGKTTLMDILAGLTCSSASGMIQLNGNARDMVSFRRSSVYITQNDQLQLLLTVQESMYVAAELKLFNASSDEKQRQIDKILQELGLDHVRKSRTSSLSGGQQKRLSIALEMISNPPVIFLDEPTSGLDSVSSLRCFELLKSLAEQGHTVICSIHQPSATIFEMIDHLYVLGGCGRCVYSGSPTNSVTYLRALGLCCPTYHNPADYLLEVATGEHGDHLKILEKTAENGKNDSWRKPRMKIVELKASDKQQPESSSENEIGTWNQIVTLTKRNVIRLSRDRILTYARFGTSLFVCLLTGLACQGTGVAADDVMYNFGLLSFILEFLMFLSMNNAIIVYPLELPTLRREYFNRWYKLHSYFIADRLADMPIQLTTVFMYVTVEYFMTGQPREIKRFSMFLLTCVLVSLVAQMIGVFIGACFSVVTASVFGPMAITPIYLFSGFFVLRADAHHSLQWLFPLSFCYHASQGIIHSIYGMDRSKLECTGEYCHYSSPKVILRMFGAMNVDFWFCMSVLFGLYLVLNLLVYSTLRMRLKTRFW